MFHLKLSKVIESRGLSPAYVNPPKNVIFKVNGLVAMYIQLVLVGRWVGWLGGL